jgi:hypothetical protein
MVPSYIQIEGSTNGFFTNLLDYDCYKTSGPSDPEFPCTATIYAEAFTFSYYGSKLLQEKASAL